MQFTYGNWISRLIRTFNPYTQIFPIIPCFSVATGSSPNFFYWYSIFYIAAIPLKLLHLHYHSNNANHVVETVWHSIWQFYSIFSTVRTNSICTTSNSNSEIFLAFLISFFSFTQHILLHERKETRLSIVNRKQANFLRIIFFYLLCLFVFFCVTYSLRLFLQLFFRLSFRLVYCCFKRFQVHIPLFFSIKRTYKKKEELKRTSAQYSHNWSKCLFEGLENKSGAVCNANKCMPRGKWGDFK